MTIEIKSPEKNAKSLISVSDIKKKNAAIFIMLLISIIFSYFYEVNYKFSIALISLPVVTLLGFFVAWSNYKKLYMKIIWGFAFSIVWIPILYSTFLYVLINEYRLDGSYFRQADRILSKILTETTLPEDLRTSDKNAMFAISELFKRTNGGVLTPVSPAWQAIGDRDTFKLYRNPDLKPALIEARKAISINYNDYRSLSLKETARITTPENIKELREKNFSTPIPSYRPAILIGLLMAIDADMLVSENDKIKAIETLSQLIRIGNLFIDSDEVVAGIVGSVVRQMAQTRLIRLLTMEPLSDDELRMIEGVIKDGASPIQSMKEFRQRYIAKEELLLMIYICNIYNTSHSKTFSDIVSHGSFPGEGFIEAAKRQIELISFTPTVAKFLLSHAKDSNEYIYARDLEKYKNGKNKELLELANVKYIDSSELFSTKTDQYWSYIFLSHYTDDVIMSLVRWRTAGLLVPGQDFDSRALPAEVQKRLPSALVPGMPPVIRIKQGETEIHWYDPGDRVAMAEARDREIALVLPRGQAEPGGADYARRAREYESILYRSPIRLQDHTGKDDSDLALALEFGPLQRYLSRWGTPNPAFH